EGKVMIRYSAYLTLAACLLVVPRAMSRQPAPAPQGQPSSTGVTSNSRVPVNPYSAPEYAPSPTRHEPYAGDPSGGSGGGVGNGTSPAAGGGNPAGTAAPSGSGPARALVLTLTASGVPHQNGQITWPRILRLAGADSQMQRLEAQLQLAAEQV